MLNGLDEPWHVKTSRLLLACSIDICDDDFVRVMERLLEIVLQGQDAAISMRLPKCDNAALGISPPSCSQGGSDFGGMVSVIVDNQDAIGFTALFETARSAAEIGKRHCCFREGKPEEIGNGEGSKRVQGIVLAGNLQFHFCEFFGRTHGNK